MAKAVGIDLGTTNSVVAVWEAATARSFKMQKVHGQRHRWWPIRKTAGVWSVRSPSARPSSIPEATIQSTKRFIGRKWGEVDEESKIVSYKVVQGPNDSCGLRFEERRIAPEEVSAQVLRKLVDDASELSGRKSQRCRHYHSGLFQ